MKPLVSRIKETDLSVPTRMGKFWYYTRTVEGQQYGIQCRVAAEGDTPPELKAGEAPKPESVLAGNG